MTGKPNAHGFDQREAEGLDPLGLPGKGSAQGLHCYRTARDRLFAGGWSR